MREKFKFGILGAARIARVSVAPAINSSQFSELSGLGTRNAEKANAFYRFSPNLQLYDSYDDLLQDPSLDGIYIPLPNHLHVEWCVNALAAGKHVLCEKPIAMCADDFDQLNSACSNAQRHLSEGLMAAYHPQWTRIRELIDEGAIGDLRRVEAVFSFNNPDPKNIRNRPETGGGALRDLGVYPLALARLATGRDPIVGPRCLSVQSKVEGGVDTDTRATIAFPGFELSFQLSMRMTPQQEMSFHGTRGWLRLTAPFIIHSPAPASLELLDGSSLFGKEFFNGVDQYQLMVDAFVREARGEVAPRISLEFSKQNQEIIDVLLLKSA